MSPKTRFIQRCFDLARLGAAHVSPNPMVGAVLVHENRIIGEGYHPYVGGPHAEVVAVRSVQDSDRPLIPQATLYVSLEPCSIHGRTPPCTQLILREGIKQVVIAQRDFTPGVDGAGIRMLRANGVTVEEGVLREAGFRLSLARNIFVTQHRPYLLLKFAQTRDGYFSPDPPRPFWITNAYSKWLVHKWRSETDAVLVGANTARVDNPQLTNRLWPGRSPLRLLIDRKGTVPAGSHLLDNTSPTWVFCQEKKQETQAGQRFIQIDFQQENWLLAILDTLYRENIAHVTVEGGAWLLTQFIQAGLWDEARVFTGKAQLGKGVQAPTLPFPARFQYALQGDQLEVFYHDDRWNDLYNR